MAKKQQPNNYKLLVISLLFFVVAMIFASSQQIHGLELSVFRAINNLSDGLRPVFITITQFGGVWFFFLSVLFLLVRRHKTMAVRFFVTGVSTYLITEIFKRVIGRLRPDLLLSDVHLRELPIGSYGFPSGHTALATVMSILILRVFAPKTWRQLALVWIVAVAVSRIYLGAHAPLDVLGGAALGVVILLVEGLFHGSEKFLKKYV